MWFFQHPQVPVFFLIGEISPKGQIKTSNFAKLNDFFWRLSIAISERGGEKKKG
jgi:hypothetical protein